MLNNNISVGLRALTIGIVILAALPGMGASGCSSAADSSTGSGSVASSVIPSTSGISTGSSGGTAGTTSTTIPPNNIATINAIQIIPKADSGGSFDAVSVPLSGGTSVRANRLFNLDGSLITVGNIPTWFVEARVFLTSTRTSSGIAAPSVATPQDTPCAYFDNLVDVNPDTSGFYTIDGYNAERSTVDIDQCAGTAASELSQLGIYLRVDRRFMNPTDKLQVIVKAKPIEAPNTTITPGSCVTSGFFDPAACANQLFTMTMRTAPAASSKPFYILFPSAKAFDLLSESVLLPINIDQSITTISIDRVKGGMVLYGISIIRLQ